VTYVASGESGAKMYNFIHTIKHVLRGLADIYTEAFTPVAGQESTVISRQRLP
jgi:hypothetical protein